MSFQSHTGGKINARFPPSANPQKLINQRKKRAESCLT